MPSLEETRSGRTKEKPRRSGARLAGGGAYVVETGCLSAYKPVLNTVSHCDEADQA